MPRPSSGKVKKRRSRPLSRGQILVTTIQIALVAVIGIVGGQAMFGMLWPGETAAKDSLQSDVGSLPQMPVALPAEGTWVLGDSPLSLGVEIVGTSDLAERMLVPPEVNLPSTGLETAFDPVLSSITRTCRDVETIGEYTAYTLNQPRMKLRLFSTTQRGHEHLVGGYLAYPRGPEAWTLVIGTLNLMNGLKVEEQHLLPMTSLSGSIGTRVAPDGTLQCEVVEVYGGLAESLRSWQNAGWAVERSSERELLCTQGTRQVHVHVQQDPSESLRCILLLMSTDALLDIEDQDLWTERASS